MLGDAEGGVEVGALDVAGDAGDDFADLEGESVGLGDAHDCGVGVAGPQHHGELAEAVEALVVDFGDHDFVVAIENILEPVGQRMDVAEVEVAAFDASGVDPFERFKSGAPR